ncbi:IS3 family transposase [Deinococcus radiophilus]|uniref:IS3 family transposase n=1 Tax=Deinococcus radiophilus TaxID=32062 RepID=UPI001E57DC2C|nr:IS3 family transposase [Deinococcus radiophilus]UFA51898.1 IS3 family transposase [Deinococcus radiophilus]UFA51905.1 IS3 family transposase [Deinococcus radiophilus]
MHDHQGEFPIALMCRVLEVSVSGYYAWRTRPQSRRSLEDEVLTEKIKYFHERSHRTYGTIRLKEDLAGEGFQVSRHRIGRLMREANLEVRYKKPTRKTTNSNHAHPVAENLLDRDFTATAPNQKWVTDITYIPCTDGWLYLATVMDLFSRRIVGWAMESHLEATLVMSALNMAFESRGPVGGVLHHSDRGSQYASEAYRQALERLGAVQRMSRKGDCWDNAVQESFFSTLKLELDLRKARGTRAQTKTEVFEWIEVFYNRIRRHSALGYQSPVAFEEAFYARTELLSNP